MTNEGFVDICPAADEREHLGQMLRKAFALGPGSFAHFPRALREAEAQTDGPRTVANSGEAGKGRTAASLLHNPDIPTGGASHGDPMPAHRAKSGLVARQG